MGYHGPTSVGRPVIARTPRRFFIEAFPEPGAVATVSGEEAHHMLNVLRLRPGDEVALLDGSGREAVARLRETSRREATLEVLRVEAVDREPGRALTLAVALPRSSRTDFLIEKCTELGVARLIPMVTERSVVDPFKRRDHHLRKWRRTTLEATKQCGRTRLMEIGPVMDFQAAVRAPDTGRVRLVAAPEPDAASLGAVAGAVAPNGSLFVLVGPEGGFTEAEVASARAAGCAPVALGRRVLRVETAAVAIAAVTLLPAG
jgi:16S rRNA (uracil1498-N3)-methyltransferase